MVKATTCEVKRDGRWQEIHITDALALREATLMRCVECQGRVRAHRTAVNGMGAHFEHLVAREGCSRSTSFRGVRVQHPERLS